MASPREEDISQVFAVRRALERAIASELANAKGGAAIAQLRKHLESESQARMKNDHAALARLTGEFHVVLAEITGNRLYAENLRRLVALTGLIIAQYSDNTHGACPEDEHSEIVRAIEAGDADKAEQLMIDHLSHVMSGIHPVNEKTNEVDFRAILGVDVGGAASLQKTKNLP